jgi:hypothetical protein
LIFDEFGEFLHTTFDEVASNKFSVLVVAHVFFADQAALILNELLVLQLPLVSTGVMNNFDIALIFIELVQTKRSRRFHYLMLI